ncbi:MAG: division/cell wall cluster transcriptional repressor MraZ [Lachnospiraceae bacterium]|nr:division/cell wall cluster transcriptional repressor MraZ [Lachnospiraceae bacterium]
MAKRFRGNYTHTIDAKGRLIIPAKYRELLGERCIVTIGQETCLAIYTEEDFEALAEKLEQLPTMSDATIRRLKRHFESDSDDQEFDKQGRVMVNASLRESAHIDLNSEVSVRGMGTHIELWNPQEWAKYNEDFDFGESGTALAPYNL